MIEGEFSTFQAHFELPSQTVSISYNFEIYCKSRKGTDVTWMITHCGIPYLFKQFPIISCRLGCATSTSAVTNCLLDFC